MRTLFDWRTATVTMAAVLASWLSAWAIANAAGLRSDVIILGTVVAATSARVNARTRTTPRGRAIRLATIAVVAVVATEVGHLFLDHPWWAGVALTAALALTIWMRRFGSVARTLGSFISLPFITVLVAPVMPMSGHAHTLWPAAIAAVALAWVTLVQWVADRVGFAPLPPAVPVTGPAPRPATGLRPSTKLAIQMGVAVGVAVVLGRWWFPEHWVWAVLSAYVVGAGNRGRGDVLLKGVQRLGGALVGTVVATGITEVVGPGERWAIGLLFVVLAFSLAFRERGYPIWAAGVTAMTALLHGYYGQGGIDLLGERIVEIVLGSAVAVAAAWFVLPIRTRDVWRRRHGDARLAAAAWRDTLHDPQATDADVTEARRTFERALTEVGLVEPTWRSHHRWVHRGRPLPDGMEHPVEQIAALHAVHARLLAASQRRLERHNP
ncbi:FUSC family protein [Nocardioides sp. Kera G14]|uniref:FUSC family protein n=1 Tax=Nocardioides sp. Kera G14 TaxID=2884264 RepID=UPI001D1129E4|nr:FUSC family protein [Nocardioides sp. Kera G14]UDY24740.1 FUSC family protein [Nocardioides sp. Kera G14]